MARTLLIVCLTLLVARGAGFSEAGIQIERTPSSGQAAAASTPPVEIAIESRLIKTRDAKVEFIEQKTAHRHALKIDFQPAEWPSASFLPGDKPWDWRAYGALVLAVTNPSSEELSFSVRMDDDVSADGVHHSRTARATIGARESLSISVPLGAPDPMDHGMRAGPPPPGVSAARDPRGPIDAGHVTSFQIFLSQPPAARTLIVNNVGLIPPASYDGIVDRFGQYTRADWPGKLKDEAEFIRRRGDEEARIRSANSLPGFPDRDEYGGWASGPKLDATGFFRTLERDGKWWLVDPAGRLFFSLGVDVVGMQEGFTLVEGREDMFTGMPEQGAPLAKHYGYAGNIIRGPVKKGRTFNFYTANLERKYGPDYMDPWRLMALDRLRAWGFNTIGNWSDPNLYDLKRVPYTATLSVHGDFARVSSGFDYWGKMPDPFDPKFAVAADQSIRATAEKYRDDPWCVGYFVDNEISWAGREGVRGHYGLTYGALAEKPGSSAKRAFIEQLQRRYGEIKSLNTAWGTEFASWDALLEQPYQPPDSLNAAMKQDFSDYLRAFARQYFRVVRDTLKKYDPNHLYLGCRFAWRTEEAVAAAAEFCDVVSFNIYDRRLDPQKWGFATALHKPCIIGEFHFGALDRGMFHPGLVSTPNQEARAAMYRDYVQSVADHPAFVGCHWFEYVDEPLTGRAFDGENYNIGFVSVTDTPYPEMVEAAQTVHARIYARRAGK